MPPKKKKGKKGKKGKKKQEGPPIDRIYCVTKISALNRQLANLRRHLALAQEVDIQITARLLEMEDDRKDVAIHLEKIKKKLFNEITEIENKIEEIIKLRAQDEIDFNEQIREIEQKYEQTQKLLINDVVMVARSLAALDRERMDLQIVLALCDDQEAYKIAQVRFHEFEIAKTDLNRIIEQDTLKKQADIKLKEIMSDYKNSMSQCQQNLIGNLMTQKIEHDTILIKLLGNRRKLRLLFKDKKQKYDQKLHEASCLSGINRHLEKLVQNKNTIATNLCYQYNRLKDSYLVSNKYYNLYVYMEKEEYEFINQEIKLDYEIEETKNDINNLQIENEKLEATAEFNSRNLENLNRVFGVLIHHLEHSYLVLNDPLIEINKHKEYDGFKKIGLWRYDIVRDLMDIMSCIDPTIPDTPEDLIPNIGAYKYRPGYLGLGELTYDNETFQDYYTTSSLPSTGKMQ